MSYKFERLEDWKEFEKMVRDIFTIKFKQEDSECEFDLYGGNGEKQCGIDCYDGATKIAIQCKNYSDSTRYKAVLREIDKELQKTKEFDLEIKKYYFVIAFNRRTIIQNHIYKLNETKEFPFRIYIKFWNNIEEDLSKPEYASIKNTYYPKGNDEKDYEKEKLLSLLKSTFYGSQIYNIFWFSYSAKDEDFENNIRRIKEDFHNIKKYNKKMEEYYKNKEHIKEIEDNLKELIQENEKKYYEMEACFEEIIYRIKRIHFYSDNIMESCFKIGYLLGSFGQYLNEFGNDEKNRKIPEKKLEELKSLLSGIKFFRDNPDEKEHIFREIDTMKEDDKEGEISEKYCIPENLFEKVTNIIISNQF